MPLADYVIERREVNFKGKTLVSVRALNFEDISVLVRGHLVELTQLVDSVSTGGEIVMDAIDVQAIIFQLVTKAPLTAAKMIAIGADEPGEVDKAKLLSAPLQIQIISDIVELTFEDVGGPLAFRGMVYRIIQSYRPQIDQTMLIS